MRSHLLVGKVRHRRSSPTDYALEHDVWYVGLDLAEVDVLDRRLRLFGRHRWSVAAFIDADHLPTPSTDLDADLRAHLRGQGMDPAGWRVTLVTNLRILGYVFNPASFYLCRDADGGLCVVVIEVHNTHGERHLYTLRRDESSSRTRMGGSMAKAFYVSPFIDMVGRYVVTVSDDADGLRIGISERMGDRPLLSTSLVLRRRPLTDRNLLGVLTRYPVVSHKTIALIHWHALRLWLRGVPFNRHAAHLHPTGLER